MQLGPSETDLKEIQVLFDELKPIYQSEGNVHSYANRLGKACQQVNTIDTKYKLSQTLDFDQVRKEILSYCEQNVDVLKALNTINASTVDSETGLNVKELLTKAWFLAKKPMFEWQEAQGLIIDNLKHNVRGGGGCLAGISARLTQPYIFLVKLMLEHNKEDAELARVIEASKKEASLLPTYSNYQRSPSPPLFKEDTDLDYALKLSRVEY